ncbi:hypothetical protein ALO71_200080 [Pseudomonas amygdali pv. dendropanacis]|uniref:30S ribosomal protein S11 n=1 Tax=Pseudomonas amygdali pv. dendropanacis TaxID=235272 RepID=A0A0P9PZ73_PSEA0|nr:hypothetical protein ALO71_200080 [Pseudomonas amygdali pv. dendropanacis]
MPVSECPHELAQNFRRTPIFGQASPLERLTEFPFNTDTETSVFARHRVIVSYGYTFVHPYMRWSLELTDDSPVHFVSRS